MTVFKGIHEDYRSEQNVDTAICCYFFDVRFCFSPQRESQTGYQAEKLNIGIVGMRMEEVLQSL